MHNKISDQIKDAMRAHDEVRLTTLRGVLAAFTNELKSASHKAQESLNDNEAIAVIRRLVKQRKDSIEQFEKGGRSDLAENEKAELKILEEFLPAQMSEEKIREIIMKTLRPVRQAHGRQAQGDNNPILKNKGAFIGIIIKETKGEADGALVKKLIEEVLS